MDTSWLSLGNYDETDSSPERQVATPPSRLARLATQFAMSNHPSAQHKALAAMNQGYHHTPLTPGGGPHHHEHHLQQTRVHSDLLTELRQTQGHLSFARSELDRIHALLDEAYAQAKHDRELIIGMQAKISELESRISQEQTAMVVSSSRSRTGSFPPCNNSNSSNNYNGSEGSSQSGPAKSGSEMGTSPRFPDSYDQSASQYAMRSSMAEKPGDSTSPDSVGGPVSPAADLFSPFPSMVLGPQFTKPIKIEDPTFNEKDFGQKLGELWDVAESYAKAYTNTPNTDGDREIQGKLLECVMWGCSKHTVAGLMNDESSRFLVVAKALNNFIAREILKIGIVEGFDSTADSEISQLKTNSYSSKFKALFLSNLTLTDFSSFFLPQLTADETVDTPIVVKRPMYDAAAKQVVRIRNMPLFGNFYNKRMHDKTKDVFDLLSPLIRNREQAAWTEMANLIKEAHNLALQMYSGPYEFNFRHAKMNDTFDPTVMVDRETAPDQAKAFEMQGAGRFRYRVKFATTPLVYFRNVSVTPVPPMTTASAAQVLLHDVGLLHYQSQHQTPYQGQYQGQYQGTPQRYHEHQQWQQIAGVEIGRPGMTPHP